MSEPFDFDAFIAGTQLARGTVAFFRVDHRPEIARLTREHDALPADGGDDREASVASPRQELAARIKALRTEMEDSRVTFTIRTLTSDEFKAMQDNDDLDAYDQLAAMSKAPDGDPSPAAYADLTQFTRDQWKRLADRIGMSQWGQIVHDANNLILSKVAVPDFSPTVSETLSPRASSES